MTATYNPRVETHKELERRFVGRGPILEGLLEDLRRQAASATRQHWLIRAPRGHGKTHLLALVYHRVREDSELGRAYYPVWLHETAAYEAYSTASLLELVGRTLTEQLRADGDPEHVLVGEHLKEALGTGDDEGLFAELREQLQAFCRRRGHILLVLLENFDAFFGAIAPSQRFLEETRFRGLLTGDREFLLLASTPARHIKSLQNPEAPLYAHFREMSLPDLSEAEMGELLGRLEAPDNRSQDPTKRRVANRVFHRLTQGSPRSIVIAAHALKASGLRDLLAEFTALLDQHTAYFESRLSQQAARERPIIAALARATSGLTLKEIARATRLPERGLSTQVARLVEQNVVRPQIGHGGKGEHYELSDGLFRLWYQYRQGLVLLGPLVDFLVHWFTPEELRETFTSFQADPASASETRMALQHLAAACQRASTEEFRMEREALVRSCEQEIQQEKRGQAPSLQRLDTFLWSLKEAERPARARNLNAVLGDLISCAKDLVDSAPAEVLERMESLLNSVQNRPVLEAHQVALFDVLNSCGVKLGRANYHDAALLAFERVIEVGDRPTSSPAFLAQVARALINKGITLDQLDRGEDGIGAYDQVASRFGEAKDPDLQQKFAVALVNKGGLLGQLGRVDEEINVYDMVVGRFGDALDPVLIKQVAMALFNKGVTLARVGKTAGAIGAYDDLVHRFGEATDPTLQLRVAMALVNKGVALGQLGQCEEQISVCDEVARRIGEATDPDLQVQVAMALVNKGVALGRVGKIVDGIRVFDQVVHQFGESSDPAFQKQVSLALVSKSLALGQLGQREQEITVCEDMVHRFGETTDSALLRWVARALLIKANAVGELGRNEEEIDILDEVVSRFSDATDLDLQEQVANAQVNKSVILGQLGRGEDAIRVCDELIHRFIKTIDIDLLQQVAKALVTKSIVLGQLGQGEEAIRVCDEVINRFGEAQDPGLRGQSTMALLIKMQACEELSRWEEADDNSRKAFERWKILMRSPETSQPFDTFSFQLLLERLPFAELLGALEDLGKEVDPGKGAQIGYFSHILRVLIASKEGKERSPAERRRRALAELPPEIRETVAERVEQVLQERQNRKRVSRAHKASKAL